MYANAMQYLYTDFTSLAARKTSLKGLPYAEELANIGAYLDAWNGHKITCHKCSLTFQIDAIRMMMEREQIGFEAARCLIHIIHHPWCEFLKSLSPEFRNEILGTRLVDLY